MSPARVGGPGAGTTVVLLSSAGTLDGLGRELRRRGRRLVRLQTIRAVPRPPADWRRRLARYRSWDTLALTSAEAARLFVRAVPASRLGSRELWSIGPATARALGRCPNRRRPRVATSASLRRALRGRARRIVYPRSDRAGPGFARALRSDGHRVLDLVLYELRASPGLTPVGRAALAKASMLIVTSPSALSAGERAMGRTLAQRLRTQALLVTLGPRTRAAARARGYRRIALVPPAPVQRFTSDLLLAARHARSRPPRPAPASAPDRGGSRARARDRPRSRSAGAPALRA